MALKAAGSTQTPDFHPCNTGKEHEIQVLQVQATPTRYTDSAVVFSSNSTLVKVQVGRQTS